MPLPSETGGPLTQPPVWTDADLRAEAARSVSAFRDDRLSEVAHWRAVFDAHHKQFVRLLHEIGPGDPGKLWPAQVANIFAKELGDAFRYLAGPPISVDDLRVLAGASLAPARLANDPDAARRILNTIRQRLDDRRFPWIADRRAPTGLEQQAAIMASAAMMTAQSVGTGHRILKEPVQEKSVRDLLVSLGYPEAAARPIADLDQAPARGQFCGRCVIGSGKADLAVRLFDGRLLAITCEVSNSYAAGNKRLQKEATAKARSWSRKFENEQVIPTAVLAGLFEIETLVEAQSAPLTLFWSHDLSPLRDFISATMD
jgi:hypothetical protein